MKCPSCGTESAVGAKFCSECGEPQADWVVDQGRADSIGPLLAEAREVLERLRVAPSLERIDRLDSALAIPW